MKGSKGQILGVTLASFFVFSAIPQAQSQTFPEDMGGGHIAVSKTSYDPISNTATSEFLVGQTFLGEQGKFVMPGGTSQQGPITKEEPFVAITGELFTPIKFIATRTYPSSLLTCSEPEDRCRGCIATGFEGSRRVGDLVNGAVTYRVVSYYNVKAGVLPPAFYGNTWLQFEPGKLNAIPLKNFIIGQKAFSCALRDPNPNRSGIEINPSAGGLPLEITPDCTVNWNTRDAQVGQKYAFQMTIQEDGSHFCRGYSEVDFIAEIGCASGDLECLQCTNIDVQEILKQTQAAFAEQAKFLEKLFNKNKKLQRKVALRSGSLSFYLVTLRKQAKLLKQKIANRVALIEATLLSQPQLIQSCLRPSSLFCTRVDVGSAIAPITKAAFDTSKDSKKQVRRTAGLRTSITGKKVQRNKKDVNRAKNLAEATMRAIAPLNGVMNQCGTVPLNR